MRILSRAKAVRRGSTLVLFTLMLPTMLIPLAGLGIDATMLYIVQAKLAAAVDGAALGAGRLLGTLASPNEIAGEFLTANFRANGTAGFWGAFNLTPTIAVSLGTTKSVHVTATADVPLLFARIFGFPTARVSAAAMATRRDSRVVLVIDRSGSMNTIGPRLGQHGDSGRDQLLAELHAGFHARRGRGRAGRLRRQRRGRVPCRPPMGLDHHKRLHRRPRYCIHGRLEHGHAAPDPRHHR